MVYWPFQEMFSDIRNMQITTSQKTRQCPFCAETILAAALKCRHCGEFLNTERAKAYMADDISGPDASESVKPGEVLFAGQPTLWAMTRTFLKGGALLTIAAILIIFARDVKVLGLYLFPAGLILALAVIAVFFHKIMKIRMTNYAVSAERIEYSTGVFSHQIDNLDMFRVVDIKLRRSIFDRIVGIGTVTLTTTDKSHPEFVFEKVRNSRELYDIIKKASLSADRKTNVIHME
jgi:membrane protein YdbS with pleckstrin-like domain